MVQPVITISTLLEETDSPAVINYGKDITPSRASSSVCLAKLKYIQLWMWQTQYGENKFVVVFGDKLKSHWSMLGGYLTTSGQGSDAYYLPSGGKASYPKKITDEVQNLVDAKVTLVKMTILSF